jgi:hypothetical protein
MNSTFIRGGLSSAATARALRLRSDRIRLHANRPVWLRSPLPVLRDRVRVRACQKPEVTSGFRQALTPPSPGVPGEGEEARPDSHMPET